MSAAFDFAKSLMSMTPDSWNAAVLLGEVVDQLLDDDGLAHAGAAEEPDLAAAQVGLEEIDDLDPRLEHLERGALVDERRRQAVDRVALLRLHRPELVHRLADHVQHAAERRGTHRHRDLAARVDDLRAAHHAVGGMHADAAHAVVAQVLLHLDDHVDLRVALALDVERLVDRRDRRVELDVDDRADHLDDATYVC
jgi:hypothetical protein